MARVFTIPPGVSFVDSLASGLVDRLGPEPLALAAATVLLPTRRACRALGEAFLRVADGKPMLLPRLVPLGDIDDEELTLQAVEGDPWAALDLPPAIPDLRRRLLLTRLILGLGQVHAGGPATPAQAARLAEELARLLDQIQTERLAFDRLGDLVPAEYAEHWQITLDFLRIVTEHWPRVLAEEGGIDPADRRDRVAAAQIAQWRRSPPRTPVIAAGSTGTVPATADLIAAVAGLDHGMVILPGLDTALDDDCLAVLRQPRSATHPQYGMVRLLDRLGLAIADVAPWPSTVTAVSGAERARLLAAVMRPAALEPARVDADTVAQVLADIRRIDCPSPREEAAVIALMMREALETPGKTAALVTGDRGLARRVAAELKRWGIEIDDSAGEPLDRTTPGVFLRLAGRMIAEDFAPVALLAVLKHPLAAAGSTPGELRARTRRLERAALRGPRPAPGIAGIRDALGPDGAAEVHALLTRLETLAAPFAAALAESPASVAGLLVEHVRFAEALAATDESSGPPRLWAGEAGDALAEFVAELAAAGTTAPVAGSAWPGLLDALMRGRVVRPRYGRHPRLHVWGQLEARLQRTDLVILGGLNEGTWPADTDADPWLSRPMRADLGLPPLERRIGLAAHDFAQAFAAKEVVMTRSTRVDGTPTVPCRWLLRLDNLLASSGAEVQLAREQSKWLAWQALLDRTEEVVIKAPAPCPPVAARPRQLSVTQVEALVRDPYSVYARRILGLKALEPIDADPGAAERGTLIHKALDEFLKATPDALPPDAVDRLLAIGRRVFGEALSRPGVLALWWPRFERIAAWFVAMERERRRRGATILAEVKGEFRFDAPAGPFTLIAVADRIERANDGGLVIVDYKTGAVPSKSDVAAGFAPQLPLEGVIAEAGGFAALGSMRVEALEFWRMSGGVPPGEVRAASDSDAGSIATARAGLKSLIEKFDDPETPYVARPHGDRAARSPDYDHLARVKEWLTRGRGSRE